MGQWELFLNHVIDAHINAGLRVKEINLPYNMYDMVRKEFNDKINPPDDHIYNIFSYKDCYIGRSMGLKTTSIVYERIKEEDIDFAKQHIEQGFSELGLKPRIETYS